MDDKEFVSDSEESVEIPLQVGINSSVLPNPGIVEGNGTTDSEEDDSDTDEDEDEIIRDKENYHIYVKRVVTSLTTKTGKAKKCDRVYNARHCCPFSDCHGLCATHSR